MSRERVRKLSKQTIISSYRKITKKQKYKLTYVKCILINGKWRGKYRSVNHRITEYELNKSDMINRWCFLHIIYLKLKNQWGSSSG